MKPFHTFLSKLNHLGVKITAENGKLSYEAPKGVVDSALLSAMRLHKTELLSLFTKYDEQLTKIPLSSSYSLSNAQRRLWVIDQLDGGSGAYNMSGVYELLGDLNEEAFISAIMALIDRHESLRTQIHEEDGEPVQVVRSVEEIEFDVLHKDWRNIDDVESRLVAIQSEESRKPFDLGEAPLLRIQLIRLEEEKRVLVFTMHHIVSDGWSIGVLMRDVAQLYEGFLSGKKDVLEILNPLRIHYKDYSAWQQERLIGEQGEKLLGYWKEKLNDGAIEPLDIPTDYLRGNKRTFNGDVVSKTFSRDHLVKLKKLAQQESCTLFMVLMAVTKVLLRRYSNQSEITVGTGTAGRDHVDLKCQIGFYVNTLVIHDEISIKSSFREVLAQVKETMVGAYEHSEYPFDSLVEQLGSVERGMSRNPLFDVMVMMGEQWTESAGRLEGIDVRPIKREVSIAKFDWSLTFNDTQEGLILDLEYNSDLYSEKRMESLLEYFGHCLDQAMGEPGKAIRDYQQALDLTESPTGVDYPREKPLHSLFEEIVELHPDRSALSMGGVCISYAELNRRANQLANLLRRDFAIKSESVVGIRSGKNVDYIVAVLAVVKAGGAYLPVDPNYPTSRQEYMLHDAQANLLLSDVQTILTETKLENFQGVILELSSLEIVQENPNNLERNVFSDNLAYIIYTSGSTGEPKGVCTIHRNVSNLILAANYAELSKETSIVLNSSISFDASTFEIWATLLYGGKLVIPGESEFNVALFTKEQINTGWLTVGLLNVLITDNPESLKSLNQLLIGGEALSRSHVELSQSLLPDTILINGYGPTETTTFACCGTIGETDINRTSIPIGRGLNNTGLYIDSSCGAVEKGELVISGDGVSRGYLHKPHLTAQRFVPSAFGNAQVAYRSGDLCRYIDDGRIEYLGRGDSQIKLRGFRIELEEIQTQLEACEGIEHAVAIVCDKSDDDQVLCAYWVGEDITNDEIVEELNQILPFYMIPQYLEQIDSIPLTVNGKLDRRSLPKPQWENGGVEYESPKGKLEESLAEIWQEVLGVDKVGRNDNFYALGGNSLSSIKILAKLGKDTDLSINTMLSNPQLKEMAQAVSVAYNSEGIEIQPYSRIHELSAFQKNLWILEQYGDELARSAYNMPFLFDIHGDLNVEALSEAFKQVISRHESLRTIFYEEKGIPVAEVRDDIAFEIEALKSFSQSEVTKSSGRPFNLSEGPLFRVTIYKDETGVHLLMVMHHIIGDGWSLGVMVEELSHYYNAHMGAKNQVGVSPLKLQQRDCVAWLNSKASLTEEAASYCHKKLSQVNTAEIIPDYKRKNHRTYVGKTIRRGVSVNKSNRIKKLCSDLLITEHTLFVSLMSILLAKMSSTSSVRFGTVIATRDHEDMKNQIGFYVNTLTLCNDVDLNVSFEVLVKKVAQSQLESYSYGAIPFENLLSEMPFERVANRHPFFDIMLLKGETWHEFSFEKFQMKESFHESNIARYDLTLSLQSSGSIDLQYNTDLYSETRMNLLLDKLEGLYEQILNSTADNVEESDFLMEEEKRLLEDWNSNASSHDDEKLIHRIFEKQVCKCPDAVALICENKQVSYSELNRRANQLAHFLRREYDMQTECLVGISLQESSVELIVAILGVLKAGGAYVPIDNDYPSSRKDHMLADSGVEVLIISEGQKELYNELSDYRGEVLELCISDFKNEKTDDLDCISVPENLLYVIYTSGSTGQPKGSGISHANFFNTLKDFEDNIIKDEEIRPLLVSSPSFDLTQKNFFLPLMRGSSLIIENNFKTSPHQFSRNLLAFEPTWINCTPSVFETVCKLLPEGEKSLLHSLQLVILGGEELNHKVAVDFIEDSSSNVKILNSYGPTECSDVCVRGFVDSMNNNRFMSIGSPSDNVAIQIVDQKGRAVSIGSYGELCVQGLGVGRGYIRKPSLTAEKYRPSLDGEREYFTGDVCRWSSFGDLEYLGRDDGQIKIRGMRVELMEIEEVLKSTEMVKDAAVIHYQQGHDEGIIAYVVLPSLEEAVEDVGRLIRSKLSVHMIPLLLQVESLPLTPNGKVDRQSLKMKAVDINSLRDDDFQTPDGELEEGLALIWSDILRLDRVARNRSFFEIGGNSLAAVRVIAEVNNLYGVELNMRDFFNGPTIEGLADSVLGAYLSQSSSEQEVQSDE